MHHASDPEKSQANLPDDKKPRPNEVVWSLFPGTFATYVPGEHEEDRIGGWYWALLTAIFLMLGWFAWTKALEASCLKAGKTELAESSSFTRSVDTSLGADCRKP